MKVVATDSAVTVLSVAIDVTLMSLSLLSQRCARFCCHSVVLVFAVPALCTSVSSNRCGISPVYTMTMIRIIIMIMTMT